MSGAAPMERARECRCGHPWRLGDGPCRSCGSCEEMEADSAEAAEREADDLRAEVTRLTEALRFLCRADTDVCDFCGATATKRSPEAERWGAWWCDVCAPPDAVDHEHAATLRPLLPPRGAK